MLLPLDMLTNFWTVDSAVFLLRVARMVDSSESTWEPNYNLLGSYSRFSSSIWVRFLGRVVYLMCY
jgi:hypothetical protein